MPRPFLCALLLWAAVLVASCTDFVDRTQVQVSIDAEPALRERIRYVDVEVRSGSVNADVWDLKLSRRLLPRNPQGWPLSFALPRPDRESGSGYLINAAAKDPDDNTLTVVRAISAYVPGKTIDLVLEFDKACVMRDTPCPATFTCRDGKCVDPFVPPDKLAASTTPGSSSAAGSGASETAASAAAGCTGGAGSCSGAVCQAGAPACAPPPGCATRDDQGTCQACPAGFISLAGECRPALRALAADGGTLEPAFDPAVSEYVVHLPLLQEHLELSLDVPDAATSMVNGVVLGASQRWTSASLPLGDTSVVITLSAPGRASRTYSLSARREGAPRPQPTAAESGAGDEFGRSLGFSRDRLVVGAPYEDGGAMSRSGMSDETAAASGAAYVFVRDGERWVQRGYLKADSPRAGAHFGFYVALDGDQLAIAAPEDSGGGAIHMFEWDGSGFRSKGALRGDRDGLLLGRSIALSGDRLVAGAPGDDTGGSDTGSAYVFERSAGEWKHSETLRPAAPGLADYFGSAVALDGDTIVSGATAHTVQGALPGGAAYVFQRTDQGWKELQLLSPMVSEAGAFFGEAVSVSGDTIAVGAFNGSAGLSGGAAYVFERGGDGKFGPAVLLRPTNSRPGDFFGGRVLIRGETLLIGAPHEGSASGGVAANGGGMAEASGAAYLFSRERGGWRQLTMIKPPSPMAQEEFGYALAISGDTFLIGAPADPGRDGSGSANGAVYVFR
jgi:hypothetical protein